MTTFQDKVVRVGFIQLDRKVGIEVVEKLTEVLKSKKPIDTFKGKRRVRSGDDWTPTYFHALSPIRCKHTCASVEFRFRNRPEMDLIYEIIRRFDKRDDSLSIDFGYSFSNFSCEYSVSNTNSEPEVGFSQQLKWDETEIEDLAFWKSIWMSALDQMDVRSKIVVKNFEGIEYPDTENWDERAIVKKNGFDCWVSTAFIPGDPYTINVNVSGPIDAKETIFSLFDDVTMRMEERWQIAPEVSVLFFSYPGNNSFYQDLQSLISPVWDAVTYDEPENGSIFYPRRFAEFDVPVGETLVLPAFQCVSGKKDAPEIDVLLVNTIHRADGFGLEFQTELGPEIFQWLANTLGREVQVWKGDLATRWGWYAQPKSTDSCEIVRPLSADRP